MSLQDENAVLRELVRGLYRKVDGMCTGYAIRCEDCSMNGETCYLIEVYDRLDDLGIEVDG